MILNKRIFIASSKKFKWSRIANFIIEKSIVFNNLLGKRFKDNFEIFIKSCRKSETFYMTYVFIPINFKSILLFILRILFERLGYCLWRKWLDTFLWRMFICVTNPFGRNRSNCLQWFEQCISIRVFLSAWDWFMRQWLLQPCTWRRMLQQFSG